jgi:hypothetical protein
MGETPRVAEISLSAAWHTGAIPARLTTTDGAALEIVHRGTWSHGLGPDFRDALVLFDGRELRAGGVEIHLRTRGWVAHGHHLDPAYDSVILHVVGEHDAVETRRSDGALVPVVAVGPASRFTVPEIATWDWDRVGGGACAKRSATGRPEAVRAALWRLGDLRLAARSARLEARLAAEPPGEILWAELLDGLGFTANRAPMRALAQTVSLAAIEDLLQASPERERLAIARGVLLGAAGFLPLSPIESHLAGLEADDVAALEAAWRERGAPWAAAAGSPQWRLARVRPANHPVARLTAAAQLLTAAGSHGGLLAAVAAMLVDCEDPIPPLRAMTGGTGPARLGTDRAIDILASGIIPLALALASQTGDAELGEATARHWERLPAPAANAVSRRAAAQVAGTARLPRIGARGAQGLIHLDTALCQPRRCFECPIAALELSVND